MRYITVIVLGVFLTVWPGIAPADTPLKASGVPAAVAATLYAEGPFVDVLQIAAQGPWLYAAVRDLEGAQRIDVWRVAPPAPPVLVDALVYGNLQDAPFTFSLLAIVPRDGVVLIQAEEVLRTYRHGADGKLVFIEELNPVTGLGGPLMAQLSVGGAFASHEQQVAPDQFVGQIPDEAIHQQVILSLRDPAHPFLIRAPGNGLYGEYLDTSEPVNTLWEGLPASITFDPMSRDVVLTTFERKVQSHLDTFWSGKLDALFVTGALDLSIEAHVRAALGTLNLPALRGELLTAYAAALDLNGVTLEALIREQHLGTEGLDGVLAAHGLSLDESLEGSLRKLAVEGLDEALRAELGRLIFQPALNAWLNETLGFAWEGLSSAQVAAEIAASFDAEIDADGVARYLTLKLIAPLLDDPAFMTWTLGELIDVLVESDLASILDATLTATGAGFIGTALDIIDGLPGFSLPGCASFPRSTRSLLELALYSGGAELDPGGFAWFEILKFYQYLTGGESFDSYVETVEDSLRGLHLDLAEDFTRKYLGFFAGIEGFALADDALASIAESAALDQALGDVLARAAMARLESAGHATNVTLREFLQGIEVPFDVTGDLTGDVDSLVAGLTVDGLHEVLADDLFLAAESVAFNLGGHLEASLMGHLQAVFGLAEPGLTLRIALYRYLTEQFNLSTGTGFHLEDLLDAFAVEVQALNPLGAYLTQAANAFDGDCIATWLTELDIAILIAIPLLVEEYPIAVKLALTSGYEMGIEAGISAMFSLLANFVIGDLSGHWASWTEQVSQDTHHFAVPESEAGYDVLLHGAFVWRDRVVLLLGYRSQADPFGLRPLQLRTFHPGDPEGSRVEIDLGLWEQVDFATQAGKDLYVSGRHPVGTKTGHGLLLDLDRLEGRHFAGDAFLPLAATDQIAALDNGALLALRGLGRVSIVPNVNAQSPNRVHHASDIDADGVIRLSELLRVIQFYNLQGYRCADSTEDGYAPGTDATARVCAPHASDYNPQDWRISLSELLRLIQFYNVGVYSPCAAGEDGFCAEAA